MNDEPQLGLATTRELLEELKARGDVASRVGVVGVGVTDGWRLWDEAKCLLDDLEEETLNYRTVDSE